MSEEWDKEEIPDDSKLFYRLHDASLKKGRIHQGCFRQQNGDGKTPGMSVDWEKYSTAEECCLRAKNSVVNSVVSFIKGSLDEIDGVVVHHAPDSARDNRAHTNVQWDESNRLHHTRIRALLLARCKVEIHSSALSTEQPNVKQS